MLDTDGARGLYIYPDNYCRILLPNDISKKKREIKNNFFSEKILFFFNIERGSKLAAV